MVENIDNPDSFEVMHVYIDTNIFNNIEAEMVLSIGDIGFRIKIKEVGGPVLHKLGTQQYVLRPPMEAVESNTDTTVKEGPQDYVAWKHDMAICDWRANSSNSLQEGEGTKYSSSKGDTDGNNKSSTKTKTVNLDGCTNDLLKSRQPICRINSEAQSTEGGSNPSQPPGFEKRQINRCSNNSQSLENEQQSKECKGPQRSSGAEASPRQTERSSGQSKQVQGRERRQNTANRERVITRSISTSSISCSSSGSIHQLAKDALQVGSVLGVKVVESEKAAVQGIKATLKSNRKLATSQKQNQA